MRSSARLVPETERTKALKDFMVRQCIAEMNNKMERLGTQTVPKQQQQQQQQSITQNGSAQPSSTLPKQKKLRKMTEEEKAARRERKRLEQTANF